MSGLIKIFVFNTKTKDNISESIQTDKFKPFYLRSTANSVVERKDTECEDDNNNDGFKNLKSEYLASYFPEKKKPSEQIKEIVANIIDQADGDLRKVNMVLKIHGYNTSEEKFCENCVETAKEIEKIHGKDSQILLFFGYRWPSEPISPNRLLSTLSRFILPLWLQICGGIGVLRLLIDLITYLISQRFNWIQSLDLQHYIGYLGSNNFLDWSIIDLLRTPILFVFRCSIIFVPFVPFIITLMLMRGSEYFQDSYRAINHGVPDLVQFFRVFDYCIEEYIKKHPNATEINAIENNRINLSFVAHSMGAFITTNLIRILSDVFDDKNVSNTLSVIDEDDESYKSGSPNIGSFFTLNRMVLVAPDIPVNTVLLERSNYLGSSLVRFKESYLFSNRADMVLLLFSTAANYLSFPSCTPKRGYRLGNLGVDSYVEQKIWQPIIVRIKTFASILSLKERVFSNGKYELKKFKRIKLKDDKNDKLSVLSYLVVGIQNESLLDKGVVDNIQQQPYLAQRFTYFDCTDYLRRKILDIKGNFEAVDLIDYFWLSFKFSFTHSGYFDRKECPETHDAIYQIACQGFDQFSDTENGKKILRGYCEIKVLRSTEEIE